MAIVTLPHGFLNMKHDSTKKLDKGTREEKKSKFNYFTFDFGQILEILVYNFFLLYSKSNATKVFLSKGYQLKKKLRKFFNSSFDVKHFPKFIKPRRQQIIWNVDSAPSFFVLFFCCFQLWVSSVLINPFPFLSFLFFLSFFVSSLLLVPSVSFPIQCLCSFLRFPFFSFLFLFDFLSSSDYLLFRLLFLMFSSSFFNCFTSTSLSILSLFFCFVFLLTLS